jgi:hypothetical protein
MRPAPSRPRPGTGARPSRAQQRRSSVPGQAMMRADGLSHASKPDGNARTVRVAAPETGALRYPDTLGSQTLS